MFNDDLDASDTESTSDAESDRIAMSQLPSLDPIIGGTAAATPLYRPFSDYCAPHDTSRRILEGCRQLI